ncbi:hypothetical protein ACQFYA_20790 [Promicromonospora sp. Marseille-Q5078]
MSTTTGVFIPWRVIDQLGPRELPAAIVLCTIADLGDANGWVSTSVRQMALDTHLSDPQVRRAFDLLVEIGALERRTGAGLGRYAYSFRVSSSAA